MLEELIPGFVARAVGATLHFDNRLSALVQIH